MSEQQSGEWEETDAERLAPQARTLKAAPVADTLEAGWMALILHNGLRVRWQVTAAEVMLAAILMMHVPPLLPLLWCLLASGATHATTLYVRRIVRHKGYSDADRMRAATWCYAGLSAVDTAVLLFMPYVPMSIRAILTLFLVGMSAGLNSSVAGCRPVTRVYSGIMLTAVAVAWALMPDSGLSTAEHVLWLLIVLLYLRVLWDHGLAAEDAFRESYRIRQERGELTSQLREALDKAEAANQAKTRFLASASHDLRQPMHALTLFSGTLMLRELDARSAGIAGQIDKAVRVLGSQLDGLLDVSRLDAGVVEHSISAVDLASLLAQIEEEFAPLAERKGLRFELRCADRPQVLTDPSLLHRVLANLVSNAIKYTARGTVTLSVEREGSVYRVAVRDTGVGIPQSEQEKVFEEFYQIGNAERDRSQGLGLGLAIVRRIGEMLNIKLRMRSTVGIGSEFTLELPCATDAIDVPPAPADAAPAQDIPRTRILVVDDEEDVRLGMQTLLEEMGFCVRVAASTEAAVECTRSFEPALVLADLRLRGEDGGLRVIETLRRVWPRLPALLITGDTAPLRLREAHDAGVELLHKPVAADQLREVILRATAASEGPCESGSYSGQESVDPSSRARAGARFVRAAS